jgi:type I restriction enzyme S subunit
MSDVPEGYKMSEVGVIPEEWAVKRFEEVMTGFSSGATPYRGRPEYYKGNIRWITSGELNYNVITDTIEKITENAVRNTNLKIHPKGTFLMAITGLEAEGTRGSCGIVGAEATTNQSCMALFPTRELLTEYLFHYYVNYGNSLALEYCQGTKQQSYTAKIVKILPIIVPPTIEEQQAIASALSDVDALITALEQLITKKCNIKQGTMQQLLTGEKRLPGFGGEWKVKKLGEYVTIASGESPSKFKYKNNGTPYYKVDQLNYGNKYQKDTPYFIECNNPIPKGSIIFPKRGASILLNKVRILTEDAFMDTNLMTLTTTEELDNEYLYYMLIYIGLWHVADTTSIPQINNKHIKPLEIPFPSPSEQRAIAQILSDMDTEIESLEQKRNKYKAIKQGMMQELLTGKRRLA